LLKIIHNLIRRTEKLISIIIPNIDDLRDELHHSRLAMAAVCGYVSGGIEGFLLRSHDDRKGPAAPAGHASGYAMYIWSISGRSSLSTFMQMKD